MLSNDQVYTSKSSMQVSKQIAKSQIDLTTKSTTSIYQSPVEAII